MLNIDHHCKDRVVSWDGDIWHKFRYNSPISLSKSSFLPVTSLNAHNRFMNHIATSFVLNALKFIILKLSAMELGKNKIRVVDVY